MEIQNLDSLGLSQGEITVYSALLNLGRSALSKIHERTGFERRAIYDILNKLVQKGLISYTIERGKRTYQCAPPSRLQELIQKNKQELSALENSIPLIEEKYAASKPQINSEIFRGKDGIKAIFEDMLNHKNIYAIGGGFFIVKELPHYWPQYNKRRIKAKSRWHNLVRNELKGKRITKTALVNIKILPKEFSGNPAVIIIYANKVVNLSWGSEWFGFMIENREIAENYKKYHNYLWKNIAKAPRSNSR